MFSNHGNEESYGSKGNQGNLRLGCDGLDYETRVITFRQCLVRHGWG
jgi:hypothetical protein